MDYVSHGEKIIQEAIEGAHAAGKSLVRISGNYEIAAPVVVPSHTTLLLEDCRLRLADGVYSQIFVNEHAHSHDERDTDIHIKGLGTAVLDGGEYNGLGERNQCRDGRPPIWYNNFIILGHVDFFSVENISCVKSRWYSMLIIDSTNGTVRDIFFDGDCRRRIEKTGEIVQGLVRERYEETINKNGDGVDICTGCHDILIENISGFTEDDTVALGALFRKDENGVLGPTKVARDFGMEGKCPDVYNIIVRNIRSSCFCSPVRIINQGGPKIYNVLIDGVFDASLNDYHTNHGDCTVMIGDSEPYGDRQPSCDETFNIIVRNVCSRADHGLSVCGGIASFTYESVYGFDRCADVVNVSGAVIKNEK